MGLVLAFLCGIANFALHKAVLESRHPVLGHLPRLLSLRGGKVGLAVEFGVLLGSMLMIAAGAGGWLWGYAIYSLVNALAAWLILSGRV
jgi:hypothetical protein